MRFVIYAPRFDENSGGSIVLYKLYEILSKLGHESYIEPMAYDLIAKRFQHGDWPYPVLAFYSGLSSIYYRFRSPIRLRFLSHELIRDAVVVYPEVVSGNPLKAHKVVRWLLHKPGFHTNHINYGARDLFFYYDKQFDDPRFNKHPENHLKVVAHLSHIYYQKNYGRRRGACYLVRKGNRRSLNYHPHGAECLDGKSHKEIARAFNKYEFFYSYDLYTMYSQYASICGCKSIIVPERNISIEQWYSDPRHRYGVAYGMDDLPRAESTRADLIKLMSDAENDSIRHVEFFARRCSNYFENSDGFLQPTNRGIERTPSIFKE